MHNTAVMFSSAFSAKYSQGETVLLRQALRVEITNFWLTCVN